MNKTLIKNVALNMREQLIEGIVQKIRYLNISIDNLEEIAYIWFIRLITIRFMEINKYIDYNMKDIIYNKFVFIKLCNDLSQTMPTVFEEIDDHMYLLLPDNIFGEKSTIIELIESIDDQYWKMELCSMEASFEDEKKSLENNEVEECGIEIIGWFYQYFFSVKKDEIFSQLKKKKLTRGNVSIATQIFTPKWIVKYMVENSLGKLWLESHSNKNLSLKWKYLINDENKNNMLKDHMPRLKNQKLDPEGIKVIDPAMGSGNILAYAFDVLYDIYISYGYDEEKIPLLILEKNLYGIDIDDRVSRLAIFTILMKARSKNSNFLNFNPKLNLMSIQESNEISDRLQDFLSNNTDQDLKDFFNEDEVQYLISIYQDAKEYGSLLYIKEVNFNELEKKLDRLSNSYCNDVSQTQYRNMLLSNLKILIQQARIMSDQYDVVIANPPYSGLRKFNITLKKFVEQNYYEYKYDLFSMFMVKNLDFTRDNGITAYMTPNVWQYISSYESLRKYIINNYQLLSLIQLEDDGFKEASVSISTFVIRKCKPYIKSTFIKLNNICHIQEKSDGCKINNGEKFLVDQSIFSKITGSKIAFWIGENTIKTFENRKLLGDLCKPRQGMATSDNNRFLRYWYEVNFEDICFSKENSNNGNCKWVPYNKGGGYRKWYGNNLYVINWENNGAEVKEYAGNLYGNCTRTIKNEEFYFKEGITYAFIGKDISPRYSPSGFIFDVAGSMIFVNKEKLFYFLGLLASKLSKHYMDFINPSINKQVGDIKSIPIIETTDLITLKEIKKLVEENIHISKNDWDFFETSWNFKRHPILNYKSKATRIEDAYNRWANFTEYQFNKLKNNEEKLNNIFINIYGISQEITPEVESKYITIRKADEQREIKSLISYAVGCMFGRYSIDQDGLIYAGGNFYEKFKLENNKWYIKVAEHWKESSIDIVENNMIPILGDESLKGDILNRFIDFIKKVFGEETLEINLSYISKILDNKSNEPPRKTIFNYFLNNFFIDHLHTYKKKPIYMAIDKKSGYKVLMYKHRFDELN